MAVLSDYVSGTITLANGSANFTGTGTGWLSAGFREGDVIFDVPGATEFMGVIEEITGEGAGTLTLPWEGPNRTNVAYRMRFMSDGSRVTAAARQLIEQLGNGNIQALAGLVGSAGKIPMFNGPGSMELLSKQDLVSGAEYDVQVANLAGRAAYDGQPAGYAVLVSDAGAGRAAIYSKNSNTSADWSAPAYVTGPEGAASTVPGVVWRGPYSGATVYDVNDGVSFNGSSFRKRTTAGAGNAPSSATPPITNTNWELLAAKGTDGAGTGDVIGPASAIADRIAVYDGATGKLLKDGGKSISELMPADYADILTSVSLLALQEADNAGAALFLGAAGNRVADSFDALTYVDVAGATNLDTSVAGVLKATIATTDEKSGTGTVSAAAGWTYVNRSFAVDNGATVDGIYLWSDVAYTGTARILLRNSGTSYSFLTGSSVSFSHTGGSTWQFFPLAAPLAIPGSGNYYCSIFGVGASPTPRGFQAAANRSYYNGDVTGTQASGWTEEASSGAPSIGVRYLSGANSLTVRSATFSALAVPSVMKTLIRVREVDAAVAGTDYTMECSRDGGTTWTLMFLTELFTSPSPTPSIRVVEAAETSVAGQPSGTAPRWRFKTLNSKIVELHDLFFAWW